jgi:translation initiation factor 2D
VQEPGTFRLHAVTSPPRLRLCSGRPPSPCHSRRLARSPGSSVLTGAPRPTRHRRALEQQLGGGLDEAAQAALDALLPPKAGDLQQAKLSAPARGLVYTLDGVAVLFDPSGRGDLLVPTVMALWRAPDLLPRVALKHPAVSQFICGAAHGRHGHGADVMLPGVDVEALPPFPKGVLVSVGVPGNPAPIAVGLAAMSSGDAQDAGRGGGKGKAVEVLQAYGDYLYAEAPGKPVPNEGFLEVAVAPLPGMWAGGDAPELLEGTGVGEGEGGEGKGGEGKGGLGGGEGEGGSGAEAAGGGGGAAAATAAEGAAASCSGGEVATAAPAGGDAGLVQNMDELLEAALLQALHKSVKDGDLPMAGSMLWWVKSSRGRRKGRLRV